MSAVGPLLTGGLLIVIGNLSGKLRPNWFIGIRTPWTLSSKTAWVRTHRIGGRLMVLLGAVLVGAALIGEPRTARSILLGGLLAFALWSLGYSYWVWRGDPDKVPPAGTQPGGES